jgi:hypothetical protein
MDWVSSHSLQAGGAMAMKLSGTTDSTSMQIDWWTSLTYLTYIHPADWCSLSKHCIDNVDSVHIPKCWLILQWPACQWVSAGFAQGIYYLKANRLSGDKVPRRPGSPRQLPAPLFISTGACGTQCHSTNLPGRASLALRHHCFAIKVWISDHTRLSSVHF